MYIAGLISALPVIRIESDVLRGNLWLCVVGAKRGRVLVLETRFGAENSMYADLTQDC